MRKPGRTTGPPAELGRFKRARRVIFELQTEGRACLRGLGAASASDAHTHTSSHGASSRLALINFREIKVDGRINNGQISRGAVITMPQPGWGRKVDHSRISIDI